MRNPWVLGGLAFLCIFLTVNAIFIYHAFSTPPNLVVDNYYERGKAYMEMQDRLQREKELGWSGVLMVPASARVNQAASYEALIQGRNSAALQLDSVTFFAYRPSDARADFSVPMHQSGHGSYVADVSFNLPGVWDLIIEARQGDNEFLVTRRIRIDP